MLCERPKCYYSVVYVRNSLFNGATPLLDHRVADFRFLTFSDR